MLCLYYITIILYIMTILLLNNMLYIHVYIYNLDYTCEYTTLSEWCAIQYLPQCFINLKIHSHGPLVSQTL